MLSAPLAYISPPFELSIFQHKAVEGKDEFQQDLAHKVIAGAEQRLEEITEAIRTLRDRSLSARVHNFAATARDIFACVDFDPNDLIAVCKYLTVHLEGAKEATLSFCDLYQQ